MRQRALSAAQAWSETDPYTGLEGWRYTAHTCIYYIPHVQVHTRTHISSGFRHLNGKHAAQGSHSSTKFSTRSETKRKRTNSATQQTAVLVFDHLHCLLQARKRLTPSPSPSQLGRFADGPGSDFVVRLSAWPA